jgi:hypothetical protein
MSKRPHLPQIACAAPTQVSTELRAAGKQHRARSLPGCRQALDLGSGSHGQRCCAKRFWSVPGGESPHPSRRTLHSRACLPRGTSFARRRAPREELLRSLGHKEDVDEARTRFGAFLSREGEPRRVRAGSRPGPQLARLGPSAARAVLPVHRHRLPQGWRTAARSPSCSGRRSAPTSSTATCGRWREEHGVAVERF